MTTRRVRWMFSVALAVAVGGWVVYALVDDKLPRRVKAESQKYTIAGRYYPIAIDNVAGIALAGDHLTIRGTTRSGAAVVVDKQLPDGRSESVPAGRTDSRPPYTITNKWLLESDATVDGSRVFSFLEKDSLDTFAIWLPGGDGMLSFTSIATPDGRDLLVFASGDAVAGPRSYYGYVTIAPQR